ncbi:hypothetical protein [Flindersiella endophytica]
MTRPDQNTAPDPRHLGAAERFRSPHTRLRWVLIVAVGSAYIGAIGTANLLTPSYGLISAGFGLAVTAGTYTAGLALALRDTLHDLAGPHLVLGAIVIAAWCSALSADPRLGVLGRDVDGVLVVVNGEDLRA